MVEWNEENMHLCGEAHTATQRLRHLGYGPESMITRMMIDLARHGKRNQLVWNFMYPVWDELERFLSGDASRADLEIVVSRTRQCLQELAAFYAF